MLAKSPAPSAGNRSSPQQELICQESPYGSTGLLPWSTGLLSSAVSRQHRKEPALLSCTTSAEPETSKGSSWLLALTGDLSGPWGSNTSRSIPRPQGKGNQEACSHRHQPGQDLVADSWLMGNDKLLYWLFTCAQIR